ncbi:MAG: cytochrome b5 domain-containing protein, partial [Dehalococcoidales bacterium]
DCLGENKYDIVLLDLGLPDSPQSSVSFTRVQSAAPTHPIIILTGLDDETFAVTTVRRGAQDYLIKGRIDTDTLVRTIRYAIARKLGGDKRFTLSELGQYDGKDGRAAYIAYNGKVYDATRSQLWKDGGHMGLHVAGSDLTNVFANAPHGEDKLANLPIIGTLVKEETLGQQLLRRIDNLHPHATFVHLSIAYALLAPFAFIGWMINGQAVFDQITLYLLVLGLITVPLSFLTGVISWILRYETKAARTFNLKIGFGILLFFTILGTYLWRITGPGTVLSQPGSYFYLTFLFIQLALAFTSDFVGKKIVYS